MLLYFVPSMRRYVRTQGEAQKFGDFKIVDVPVDKNGLMDFLNELWGAHDIELAEALPKVDEVGTREAIEKAKILITTPPGDVAEVAQVFVDDKPTFMDKAMAQCDVEEAIQNADPIALASYANNVCWRIELLTKGLK